MGEEDRMLLAVILCMKFHVQSCQTCQSNQASMASTATKPTKMLKAIESYLYRLYADRLQDPQITVEVQDLGCHMEALIKKDEKIVKRLSINGNTITELS